MRETWCSGQPNARKFVRHQTPIFKVNTEMSSLAIVFLTAETAAFYSLFPKMFTHKWSEVKKKTMGFWRLQRAAVIIQRDGWCFVHNFSSFLTAIWALPHVQVSSLCPKPLFFYLLTHLMRKTSFSVTSGMAQISVPGPDLCTLSLGSPGRTKATSILTSTTPLTVVELLQFLRSLNKHIKAG